MKVTGPGPSGAVAASGVAKRTDSGGFTPVGSEGAVEASASTRVGGPAGAAHRATATLQRFRRSLQGQQRVQRRHAGRLLDVLDEVKLALLDGRGSAVVLERLHGAVREARDGTDDPRLEGVLDEIETRAAVELAKQEVARAAA